MVHHEPLLFAKSLLYNLTLGSKEEGITDKAWLVARHCGLSEELIGQEDLQVSAVDAVVHTSTLVHTACTLHCTHCVHTAYALLTACTLHCILCTLTFHADKFYRYIQFFSACYTKFFSACYTKFFSACYIKFFSACYTKFFSASYILH
jgi:hypothetical protein